MHVYVIHLADRVDRKKAFMKAWISRRRMSRRRMSRREHLHWFPAVRGTPTMMPGFRTVAKTRKARNGRIGCYCSHVAAIETAIRRGHFPLLILEDDAIPSSGDDLEALFASANKEVNLLYFGALPVRGRAAVKGYCSGLTGWAPVKEGVSLYGGHAYGFRDAAAATDVLNHLRANKITYDSSLLRYQKAFPDRVAVYCPFQFFQSEGFSDIEGVERGKR
jgi:hypothetical protein